MDDVSGLANTSIYDERGDRERKNEEKAGKRAWNLKKRWKRGREERWQENEKR